jgi:pimeloyl-ACP methyl ester carboxylesterase
MLAYLLAALHPERVAAAVMIGTIVNVGGWDDYPLAQAMACCDVDLGEDRDEGLGPLQPPTGRP